MRICLALPETETGQTGLGVNGDADIKPMLQTRTSALSD